MIQNSHFWVYIQRKWNYYLLKSAYWSIVYSQRCFRCAEKWISFNYTHTYIYIYIYTHTHTYIYTYTHTHIYILHACYITSVMSNSLQPMDCRPPVSLSMGFSRQEYWSGSLCPPPGHLPDPGTEPASLMFPALAGSFFTTRPTGKPIRLKKDDVSILGGTYLFFTY